MQSKRVEKNDTIQVDIDKFPKKKGQREMRI
jgi:hypothetical protein